jgi:hypothetical protein
MERAEYIREENWLGSFYELSLELGASGDDTLATRALAALWKQPELRGPWNERAALSSVPVQPLPSLGHFCLYGVLSLAGNIELGCMSHLVRIEGESDWLDLSIPTGMLELRFPVAYPLDRTTNAWLRELDRLLVRIAARIYAVAPYRLGLIGEETSGMSSASDLTATDCERGGYLVPGQLWNTLAPKRVPDHMVGGIVYAPFLGPDITYGG